MKSISIIICIVASLSGTAQSNIKYYDYQWKECADTRARFYSQITATDSGYLRMDYFFQERSLQMSGKYDDHDCKIPNGQFRFFHANRYIQSFGKYVQGQKDGLWLSYHSNQMMADSIVYRLGTRTGTSLSWHANGYLKDSMQVNESGAGVHVGWFDNGSPSFAGLLSAGEQPNGKWKYYHKNGALSASEIYFEGRLVAKKYYDEQGKEQADTTNLDSEARFKGGSTAWLNYLSKKLIFPQQYKLLNRDDAVVVVSFTITEEGKVADAFVSTPFHPDFDKLALRAITSSPAWIPARDHNRKVASRISQPVIFSQED
ncbi:TonB family protein [Flavihumibacter fluvii]|uniref:TonB family protein n=1 Tax=Flavihumibacter fluvii TaxID=2838157 RepID=UPI001BDF5777|nr:TonB family protein [Flavihumibacter fluvii]ULQ53412.1 TonB family protein [Flavihumibacter fluvii]